MLNAKLFIDICTLLYPVTSKLSYVKKLPLFCFS